MIESVFIKIKDNLTLSLGVNTPKYWIASHMTCWTSDRYSSPISKEELEKYKWIPLSSKQLVWWEDD